MELFKGRLLAEDCDDDDADGGDYDDDDHDHDNNYDDEDHASDEDPGGVDDDDRHYAFVCPESQFSKDTFQSLKRKILFFCSHTRLDSF